MDKQNRQSLVTHKSLNIKGILKQIWNNFSPKEQFGTMEEQMVS